MGILIDSNVLIDQPNDLWLAATAVTHGLTFVTANVRVFSRVPGLTGEEWSAS